MLIDKAQLLTLTAPEMTVLIGGLRVLNNHSRPDAPRRAHRPARNADQRLLRNLLDMGVEWKPKSRDVFEGRDRKTGQSSGPARVSIWCSARTRSFAR
jgi:catalase-peroxidase